MVKIFQRFQTKKLEMSFHSNGTDISFRLFLVRGKERDEIQMPIPPDAYGAYFGVEGSTEYVIYEGLSETQYFEDGRLPVHTYYDILHDRIKIQDDLEQEVYAGDELDIKEDLAALGIPIVEEDMKVSIQMTGLSGKQPEFKVTLKDIKGENVEFEWDIEGPFLRKEDEVKLLSEGIWQLYQVIQTEIEDPYEKIARVQHLSKKYHFILDDFLTREKYTFVDEIELEPQLLDEDTLKLEIKTDDATADQLVEQNQLNASIKKGDTRERVKFAPKVVEDIKKIKQKQILKGDEIPQFAENPHAFFGNAEFTFNLEDFSERVKGYVVIQRVHYSVVNGKRVWFNTESGQPVEMDEDDMRDQVAREPDKLFYKQNNTYFYLDKKVKQELGFVDQEEKQTKEKIALEILKNEDELEYSKAGTGERRYKSYPIPEGLKANLFDYQKEGFFWMASLAEAGSNGLLADDMGLGKTMQVITFLLHRESQGQLAPTLIVLPKALINNWKNEIAKFAPSLSPFVYIHSGASRHRTKAELEKENIILTTYDTLKGDQFVFGQVDFQSLITDEAQNAKNYGSARSLALRAMKAKFRLAMTGTPVENSLEELWAIMDFVEPGAFSSLADFKKRYVKEVNTEELRELLQPYYLRRTKKEVLADKLPTKHIRDPYYLSASHIQQQLAKSIVSARSGNQANMLTALMNLRQAYGHPSAVNDDIEPLVKHSPKLEKVLELLEKIQKKQEKVLIFTEFRKLQSILKVEITKKFKIHVPIIDGSTDNRAGVVEEFNHLEGFQVMILSPKAAGVGLTITSANHVIHFTRWWNPAVENQATDRAYRIGQEKDVYVYHLITQDPGNFPNGTVEEIMNQILIDKSELAEDVIVPFNTKKMQSEVWESVRR
jgi:SNF2 family DNA or RNA helicase